MRLKSFLRATGQWQTWPDVKVCGAMNVNFAFVPLARFCSVIHLDKQEALLKFKDTF